MSSYRLELATSADDADLRRVMASTPMPGAVPLSFRREPSFFSASVVEGPFCQIYVARETPSQRVVGLGTRSVRERLVDGQPAPVGYLAALRLLLAHRNQGLVARGFALFRRLHREDRRTSLYLTTVAADNRRARATLEGARAGLPEYRYAGDYHTLALPLAAPRRPRSSPPGLSIRPAEPSDLPELLDFLHRHGPLRQFFPRYDEIDFFRPEGTFRDLAAGDILLAVRGGRLVGTLAAWNQQAFRQTCVERYPPGLGPLVRLCNRACALFGRGTGVPAVGHPLRLLYAALPIVVDDDAEVFAALLDAQRARHANRADYLAIGLHAADPLQSALARYRARRYVTRLYTVGFADEPHPLHVASDRVPYLELGCL